jgi:phospholipase/carboxylesterase
MPTLNGPRILPRTGTAKSLVVFLHGYGADGNDLIALGNEWQSMLPDTAFVSPNAPEPCAGAPMGRQWFTLTMRSVSERWDGVRKAAPVLDEFLDAELAKLSLPPDRLALVGFSQGTMMALHVGLRRKVAPAAIVGYSGIHVMPENEAEAVDAAKEVTSRPPVLLVHGDIDNVIPAQALLLSAQSLSACGVAVEWHMSQGIGHGIDGAGLRLGGEFLARHLRARA